jgi:co-chaperonin GroES (HSP10)
MQENEKTKQEPELFDPRENVNRPHWKRFKLQGKDRFLVQVHKQVEQKTRTGIFIPNLDSCQDIASTGTIVALSPMSDDGVRDYPDVHVGANIQVIPCTWTEFDILGQRMATGELSYIVATYDFGGKSLDEQAKEQTEAQRAALDKLKEANTFSTGTDGCVPLPPLIRVK